MFERLEQQLGYHFADAACLQRALTHKSAGSNNNERLEFLGDAVLGYVIAEMLHNKYADASEADLTIMRASLVKRDTLANLARAIELGGYLKLGTGEKKTGGRDRASILADALEAVFGAIVMDGGHARVRRVIRELFSERVDALAGRSEKDPKTRLQEILQKQGLLLPSYEIVRTEGQAHAQTYFVVCTVEALKVRAEASASTRRRAEKLAAERVIEAIDADQV